jgi:hypothetical protein
LLSYGINAGTLTEPRDLYPQAAKFVARFYNGCLGRNPDTAGYDSWLKKLKNGTDRKTALAGFVNSK